MQNTRIINDTIYFNMIATHFRREGSWMAPGQRRGVANGEYGATTAGAKVVSLVRLNVVDLIKLIVYKLNFNI